MQVACQEFLGFFGKNFIRRFPNSLFFRDFFWELSFEAMEMGKFFSPTRHFFDTAAEVWMYSVKYSFAFCVASFKG